VVRFCTVRDATNSLLVSAITYCLFLVRRAAVAATGLGRVGTAVAKVLRLFAAVLQRPLNQVLLLSVEVSMEYLMGLTNSPYVLWLKVSGGMLFVAIDPSSGCYKTSAVHDGGGD
jgi:hypothetical protein